MGRGQGVCLTLLLLLRRMHCDARNARTEPVCVGLRGWGSGRGRGAQGYR